MDGTNLKLNLALPLGQEFRLGVFELRAGPWRPDSEPGSTCASAPGRLARGPGAAASKAEAGPGRPAH